MKKKSLYAKQQFKCLANQIQVTCQDEEKVVGFFGGLHPKTNQLLIRNYYKERDHEFQPLKIIQKRDWKYFTIKVIRKRQEKKEKKKDKQIQKSITQDYQDKFQFFQQKVHKFYDDSSNKFIDYDNIHKISQSIQFPITQDSIHFQSINNKQNLVQKNSISQLSDQSFLYSQYDNVQQNVYPNQQSLLNINNALQNVQRFKKQIKNQQSTDGDKTLKIFTKSQNEEDISQIDECGDNQNDNGFISQLVNKWNKLQNKKVKFKSKQNSSKKQKPKFSNLFRTYELQKDINQQQSNNIYNNNQIYQSFMQNYMNKNNFQLQGLRQIKVKPFQKIILHSLEAYNQIKFAYSQKQQFNQQFYLIIFFCFQQILIMESRDIILITLDGKEILVNQFPYQYKKRSKIYFVIDYNKDTYDLNVRGIEPYSVKIMNNDLIQKQYPENFDKILIVKNKNNQVINNYDQQIDLNQDNVVNTITLIKMSKFQKVNKNVIKNEKQTNLITIKNKQTDINSNTTNEQFVPQILKEPEIQNPQKIQQSKQLSINLMTFEERDLLKKAILSYGYDRWEYIQKIFEEKNQLGLRKKSISQIRSYTNCLIKSIADNLNFQNYDLKQLLMYLIHQPFQLPDNPQQQIIQEYNEKQILNKKMQEDMYVCVNSRDWDLNSIRQRAKPWAKRILIMYRINNFIKDYIQYFNHKYQFKPQKFFDFFELLNFVDVNQLSGQKPSSWWSVFHDIHLLYSTYFNGYANYLHSFILKDNYKIPKTWYFYKDGQKINELGQQNQYMKLNYMNIKVDFYTEIMVLQLPNADAITRRLKKLINIIFKLSGEAQEKLQQNENLKKLFLNLQYKEIQNLIEYVKEEGIPFNINTKKFNYEELKNKVDLSIDLTGKKIQQIINLLNIIAFIVLNEDIDTLRQNCIFYQNDIIQKILQLFTKEKAEEYLRNNNVLYFLRSKFIPKNILQKKFSDFNIIVKKFIQEDNEIYNKITLENYEKIFDELNQNGFRNINVFYKQLDLQNVYSLANMIFLFFEYLKPEIENLSPIISKKRKIQYLYQIKQDQEQQDIYHPQDNRRKNYIQNQNLKDIQLPLQISSSLKILKLGKLNPNPYYHTTHCLFPIGYQSVRVYYSTKFKNQKCEYFCQILQGEKKPIFKVTSEEDTLQPYVSEDPSICWNKIYEKYCEINNKSKDNVVISGTERFGLLDSLVISMLENLDDLDKCKRYIRKNIQIIFKNQIK